MPEPHLRAGDTDREAVAAALGTHMAAGRLSLAEYDERLTRTYAAKTHGELAELTADLPATTPAAASTVSSGAAPSGASAAHPAPTACGAWGMQLAPGMAPWAWHGHGRADSSWQAWLTTSVTVLAVYLAISLASWELHYFWPMWVIGPWGAALLAQRITGIGPHSGGERPQLGR